MAQQQPFLVLKVLASEIVGKTVKRHQLLEGHEHHGFIHRQAIKGILKGEWVRDFDVGVSDKFKNHPVGTQILQDTHGLKPKFSQELSSEEMQELLGNDANE
jgi:hypothetical protein